ncbi:MULTISPECIES: hypothetical protein [Paraburkholderia]|uniref:hypothetical protein n=1 Tax=Paraburkholderia TaxID=1822464 RepID=UPI0038BBFC75
MERNRWAALIAGVALAIAGARGAVTFAQTAKPGQGQQSGQQPAQKPAQAAAPDANSSMVRPPQSASGLNGSSGPSGSINPDNMPIKRPEKPTNDKMMHEPPASGANAK